MKQSLSKKQVFFTGLMLFSLFFGAGNLIFPPILGQQAGDNFIPAMIGFIATAVGLPLLTVIAIAKTGSNVQQLAGRVHPKFGLVFAVAVYMALGPFMAIPRVSNVSFEMGAAPFVGESMRGSAWVLLAYSVLFFAVSYWLSLNPTKLVARIGNLLTPALLISIALLFVGSLVNPLGEFAAPVKEYVTSPGFKGFMEGYMTLDAIAALAFGIIVINAIKMTGVEDKGVITRATIQAGIVAGIGLALVYAALGYMGATSVSLGYVANGGQLMTMMVQQLFGPYGLVLLAVIVTLACLTTSIGLIAACAQYFSTLTTRISYSQFVLIICVFGLLVSNLGLNKIISVSIPVLLFLYPIAITLIVLTFMDKWFNGQPAVYICALIGTSVISLFDGLKAANIPVESVTKLLHVIPLYAEGIGWLIPAVIGACIGLIIGRIRSRQAANSV
ncbi:branched-chain amino acid transport system II carrier protein [Paenibacillus sp. 481]|uniref:branched-chain amino acid transport system II carrier protein n=1 Tax=Paenibacillus sp. 481 TaxID=2835869 RepID=UPI001E4379EA|nr:branched-chain amino acid transport system II carrier protein [Paenibacillus sp. 481]UHA72750.1 branched-chain amino acid transport system II carrier protein [Paenibacillus sp. 481]